MSAASERVEQWRKARRKAGYRPLTLWVPFHAKGEFDALVYARRQEKDPGQCFLDAVRCLATSMGKSPELRLEARQRHQMEQEIAEQVIAHLVQVGQVPSTALSTPVAVPAPSREPPAEGMLPCNAKKGHPDYPALTSTGTRREKCPECDKEQHRELRAKHKAEKKPAQKKPA
jgi:hypothetical protein